MPAEEDCDDNDATVSPDADEDCDELDRNCDGDPTAGAIDAQSWYTDGDADGFGSGEPTLACEAPEGYTTQTEDCDDGEAAIYPGAPEDDCLDPTDYNCDGSSGLTDADGDGFAACEECDDTSRSVNPAATEICDDVDNDCDGEADVGAIDAETWYQDADADAYGDADFPVESCDAPEGYAAVSGDCDDLEASMNPGASEVCDGLDNDCDSVVDDNASDAGTWYSDRDNDGYGDGATAKTSCEQPTGTVDNDGDCDDREPLAWTDAAEVCDEVDNNCDGSVDEGVTTTYYADNDEDGYGNPSRSTDACEAPDGYITASGDCDDKEPLAWTGAVEVCDEVDNDCDGDTDEGVTSEWTLDRDNDGFGDDATAVSACSAPTSAYVGAGGDCDDRDSDYSPGAAEGCDGNDYDCDGDVDNDLDGDTYADIACGGDDCDDSDTAVKPENSGACALGTSCLDILTKGYSTGDGTYSVDYDGYLTGDDPEDVYCEMDAYGGGWTLIATNGGSGWSATVFLATTTIGSPSLTSNYKGNAWFVMPMSDVMFTDGAMHAVYEGVDGGSQSFYDWQASIPLYNCGSIDGYNWPMTDGDFASSDLCDTDLYMHPLDEDGGVNTACDPYWQTYTGNATGPAWSSGNNNGCPLDDTGVTSFVNDSELIAWGTALSLYAR
ncbi:hypothetical protein L6R46_13390 [Myxococcota bacterium]|nr:hypothetical protein [Myxococcota bacterium]